MSVSNMVKMGLVVGVMAVLTGCNSSAPIKTNTVDVSKGVNLSVLVSPDVPNKIIDTDRIRESCLAKLKEDGIQQTETGTPITLNIQSFKVINANAGGSGNVSFAGKTGFALVDAVNQLVSVANNLETVASNVKNSVSDPVIQTRVDYKITSKNEILLEWGSVVTASASEQSSSYNKEFPRIITWVITK
jgi:hypothetical protein